MKAHETIKILQAPPAHRIAHHTWNTSMWGMTLSGSGCANILLEGISPVVTYFLVSSMSSLMPGAPAPEAA